MTTRSKYYPILEPLLEKPTFTTAEALDLGIPRHGLAYFKKIGLVERIAKGIYRDPNYKGQADITLEDLALAAYTTKNNEVIDQINNWLANHTKLISP